MAEPGVGKKQSLQGRAGWLSLTVKGCPWDSSPLCKQDRRASTLKAYMSAVYPGSEPSLSLETKHLGLDASQWVFPIASYFNSVDNGSFIC